MNDFTFKQECEVCGNKPVYKDLGMCSVCTHGEAASMWDWVDEDWRGKERKLAASYAMSVFLDTKLIDKKGNINPIVARLLHVDQHVLNQVERLVDNTPRSSEHSTKARTSKATPVNLNQESE